MFIRQELGIIIEHPPDESSEDASIEEPKNPIPWPDPLLEELESPEFEAIWRTIKTWDINVPEVYGGYCSATGNHVKAILDALYADGLIT